MQLPLYNTKSPKVAFVLQGKGYMEMVCPHLPKQRQGESEEEEGRHGQGQGGEKGQEQEEEEGRHGQGQGGEKGQEQEEEGRRGEGQGGEKGQEQEEGRRGEGQGGEKGQEQEEEEGRRGEGQGEEKGQEQEEEEGRRGEGQGEEKGQEGGRGQEEEGRHNQGEEEREGRIRYEKVRANLEPNTVYVVPPGHPVITVASEDENLQILSFDLYARGNRRHYFAGKNSILRNLEKEEMKLAYKSPSEQVRKILNANNDQGFSEGPERRESKGGRQRAVESIMGFMGF